MTENECDEQEVAGSPDRSGEKEARGRKSGTRTVPATPRDSLFRALVSDPGRAAALIRDHLPNRITGLLTDAMPVPPDGSFVDEALRGSRSDMLFKVELASGGPAFVYVLAEHKSTHPRTAAALSRKQKSCLLVTVRRCEPDSLEVLLAHQTARLPGDQDSRIRGYRETSRNQ